MANHVPKFATTDTTLYAPAVTLSTQGNAKLLHNWNQVLKEQLTATNINEK